MSLVKNSLNTWAKLLALLLLAAAGVFGVHQFMERRFCLEHICLADEAAHSTPLTSAEKHLLDTVLAQPFTYLDRGKQSYAFISRDGRYVLKFFDIQRMQRRASVEAGHAVKRAQIRQKRLAQLLTGYDVAYRFDRDNAELLFVQLAPNGAFEQRIIVSDRLGVTHAIPLGKVPFVVQRLAVPARVEISTLLERGDVAAAKERFRQLVDMYLAGYQHGIVDADHNVMYNTGFVDGQPMRIDLGRLRLDEAYKNPQAYQKDLQKVVFQRMDGWLQRHFPRYRQEIGRDLQDKLQGLFGSEFSNAAAQGAVGNPHSK